MEKPKDYLTKISEELKIIGDRFDQAVGLIRQEERELKRPLSEAEARVVLAESGSYPEVDRDLRRRAIKDGGIEVMLGKFVKSKKRIDNGRLIVKTIIIGRKPRDGD
jgi:hypothetical protein